MIHQVQFPRNSDELLARTDEVCLTVIAGETILIPRTTAVQYVKKYNSSPDEGFLKKDGTVTLSHGPSRLTLSEHEASAVVDLIKTAYAESF